MRNFSRAALLAIAICAGGTGALAEQPLSAQGKQVFDRWCAACHARSIRAPGTTALAAKYGKGLPAALEDRRDLSPDVVKYFVRQGVNTMPFFRKTEISDAELAALARYLARPSPAAK